MIHFQQVLQITKGVMLQEGQDLPIRYLLIDSRKVVIPAESLFFAIRGERHNGHRFIYELYQKGVRQFVVEENHRLDLSLYTDATIIQVQNSIRALQQIVAFHRSQFNFPVIGITGSNGKTIIKEWLSVLLGKQYNIVKNPKSYNSQVGVPLSVWLMNESHTLGIFEAGISKPDEIIHLAEVIRPTIGLFTNIGTAHDEGFTDREQKVEEKAKLFSNCKIVLCCKDHNPVYQHLSQVLRKDQQLFTWSIQSSEASIQLLNSKKQINQSELELYYKGETLQYTVPFVDDASIENSMHCISLLLLLQMDSAEIQTRLRMLQPVSMRLELKEGINSCYLIDDTYNNDLAGLTIALDFLNLQKQKSAKTLILSDLLEAGMAEQELYQHIASLLEKKGINRLIGIGEVIARNQNFFDLPATFYPDTQAFLKNGSQNFRNELILVKGARAFQFEQIVQKLQQKTHGTVLEINLDALSHNLNYYQSKLGSHTKIMVMVKAFAYGSGSAEIANLLQYHRVDYLAVAYADEGVVLRENGVHLPIMVMNPSAETFDKLLAYQLEPEIYSVSILHEFLQYLEDTDREAAVHIKLDTGMHRLGFEKQDLPMLTSILRQNKRITVASVFSHLAGADEETFNAFSNQQINTFQEMATLVEIALGYQPIRHILNSAGILRFPQYHMDMVRLGIGLYGVEANGREQLQLETVGTLKTTISQIKHLQVGETVGYSRKGKVMHDTTIATIAIGYADGFDRRFGNGVGKVLIHGKPAPVIGNVCMDMAMVDITGIEAEEGDEVIIFGKEWPILQMAKQIGTIPYELLTGVSERVKRIFYAS